MTLKAFVSDSIQNFAARLGIGTSNLQGESKYGFDFLTRDRQQLEAAYRGSWLVGAAVDMPAEDMTRAGIEIDSTLDPDDQKLLESAMLDMEIWQRLSDVVRWSRLFGGAVGVMMIDGQDMSSPLKLDTIRQGQFKGLLVLDRWMLNPSMSQLDTDFGPNFGLPVFYDVISDGQALSSMRIHHTRVIRMDGLDLPYWQRKAENGWGQSVIERIHDRLVAFDSTTLGASQLVYKAHLRTMSVDGLREIIGMGGKPMEGLVKQIELIRAYQSNEGMTLMDAKDKFETHTYTFAGLSDLILQFGQQISGATQIPLVRLFGQSPAGLNSTGESDLRTYYDGINKAQNTRLRRPVTILLDVLARSVLGKELPNGTAFTFRNLWQTTDRERADIGEVVTRAVSAAVDSGLVSQASGLKELRQASHASGLWSNITDEEIKDAEALPPRAEIEPPSVADPEEVPEDADPQA